MKVAALALIFVLAGSALSQDGSNVAGEKIVDCANGSHNCTLRWVQGRREAIYVAPDLMIQVDALQPQRFVGSKKLYAAVFVGVLNSSTHLMEVDPHGVLAFAGNEHKPLSSFYMVGEEKLELTRNTLDPGQETSGIIDFELPKKQSNLTWIALKLANSWYRFQMSDPGS